MNSTFLERYPQLHHQSDLVTFKYSNKARYLRITIDRKLQIKVTIPKRAKISDAKKFFESKILWVKNSLAKLQVKQVIANQNNVKKQFSAEEFLSRNQYLIKRCQELAQKHQLQIGKITLRKQKTLWGSCSAQNNISLNSNLIFLDDELIDYVILHELAHTKVKNHSRKFWQLLETLIPNAKILDRRLRNHQINID